MENSKSPKNNEEIKQQTRSFGQKIKNLRIERNLSQSDLAKMLGVSQKTIADYENANTRIFIDTLAQIAKRLDKPISYFYEDEGTQLARLEKKVDILFNIFVSSDENVAERLERLKSIGLKDFLMSKGIDNVDALAELETYLRFTCEKHNYNFDEIWNT